MTTVLFVLFILLALPLSVKGLFDLRPQHRAPVLLRVVARNDGLPRRHRVKHHG